MNIVYNFKIIINFCILIHLLFFVWNCLVQSIEEHQCQWSLCHFAMDRRDFARWGMFRDQNVVATATREVDVFCVVTSMYYIVLQRGSSSILVNTIQHCVAISSKIHNVLVIYNDVSVFEVFEYYENRCGRGRVKQCNNNKQQASRLNETAYCVLKRFVTLSFK